LSSTGTAEITVPELFQKSDSENDDGKDGENENH